MGKTKLIFIAALILLVLFVNADDKELNIKFGDDELWIPLVFGDEEAGLGIVSTPTEEAVAVTGATGGGSYSPQLSGEKISTTRAALEEITWGLKYIWERLKYLFNTRFREWKNIGQILSPSNPARGWFVFIIIIYCIWVLLVSLPIIIKREIRQYRETSGAIPSTIKVGIFISIAIFGLAIIWMQRNVSFSDLPYLGAKIWPSIPVAGWIVFFGFIYLGWLLMMSVPSLIKDELKRASKINEKINRTLMFTSISIIGFTFVILWWATNNLDINNWKNLGPNLLPSNPVVGWVIVAMFAYYIFWVLFIFIPNLARDKIKIKEIKNG